MINIQAAARPQARIALPYRFLGGVLAALAVALALFYLVMRPSFSDLRAMSAFLAITAAISLAAGYGAYRFGWINRAAQFPLDAARHLPAVQRPHVRKRVGHRTPDVRQPARPAAGDRAADLRRRHRAFARLFSFGRADPGHGGAEPRRAGGGGRPAGYTRAGDRPRRGGPAGALVQRHGRATRNGRTTATRARNLAPEPDCLGGARPPHAAGLDPRDGGGAGRRCRRGSRHRGTLPPHHPARGSQPGGAHR